MLLKVDNSQSGRLASLAASTDSLYLSKTAYIVLKGVVDKVAGHFNIRLHLKLAFTPLCIWLVST